MLQKYKSHKVVEAALITEVDIPRNRVRCNDVWYGVPIDFFARGVPQVDNAYLVSYNEGKWWSWSPKVDFEDGYTLVEEQR